MNTIQTIADGFFAADGAPLQASYRIDVEFDFDFSAIPPSISIEFPTTVEGDPAIAPRLEALVGPGGSAVFEDNFAYCVDQTGRLEYGVDVQSTLYIVGDDAMNIANSGIAAAVDKEENLDVVTWVLNQDFQSLDAGILDDGDLATAGGAGRNYTFEEVQEAIWFITDGTAIDATTEAGANSQEIIDLAMVAGEGFTSEAGDKVAILFDPLEEDRQAYMVGVDFELLKEECDCLF